MKFLKQISIFTFVGFFGAGVNFFVLPILSFHLTPKDYGIISLFNTYVTILIPLIGLQASSLLTVEYFKIKDKNEFSSKFISIQLVPVLTLLIFLIPAWLSYHKISNLLELEDVSRIWGGGILLLAFATIYTETFFKQ